MTTYNLNFLRASSKTTFKEQRLETSYKKILSHKIYNKAYILPSKNNIVEYGGVITKDKKFVDNTGLHEGIGKAYKFENTEYFNGTIIYIGYFNQCWGHIITDSIKKIYFLHTPTAKKLITYGAKIAYITYGNNPITKQTIELLSLLGITMENFIHIKSVTLCDTIIVPDNSIIRIGFGVRLWTQEYKETINRIKERVNNLHPKIDIFEKLYFTRTKLKHNRDYNEEKIEKLFSNRGYKIISPEKHSVVEQIYMLMNCKEFASTEGSISHNAIFLNEKTKCTIIKKADYWNSYQITINDCANIDVTFVDAHNSCMVKKDSPFGGPFFLCITKELENYFHKKIFHLPYYLTISWFRYRYRDAIKEQYYTLRAKLALKSRLIFLKKIYD